MIPRTYVAWVLQMQEMDITCRKSNSKKCVGCMLCVQYIYLTQTWLLDLSKFLYYIA